MPDLNNIKTIRELTDKKEYI